MTTTESMFDPFLKVSEAARYLVAAKSTVYNLVSTGELPALRIGRAVRIRKSDLEQFISRNMNGGTPHGIRSSSK